MNTLDPKTLLSISLLVFAQVQLRAQEVEPPPPWSLDPGPAPVVTLLDPPMIEGVIEITPLPPVDYNLSTEVPQIIFAQPIDLGSLGIQPNRAQALGEGDSSASILPSTPLDITGVPEPGTASFLAAAIGSLIWSRLSFRRRTK
jgi:hypothetical protein